MNALSAATAAPTTVRVPETPRVSALAALRVLLLTQAAATLAFAVLLSLLAAALRDFLGGDVGRAAETTVRFAAGATFLFAIFAAVAARGVRRRRSWAWTMAAVLQVLLAAGTGLALLAAAFHPAHLVGIALAIAGLLLLSAASVRRGLGQA